LYVTVAAFEVAELNAVAVRATTDAMAIERPEPKIVLGKEKCPLILNSFDYQRD
jgi:hypothetical protein